MLSDEVREFIRSGAFATLTTLLPDGRPAAQVMWIDCDDECVLINTELHRQKFKNVEGDPRVTVCVWEKDDPYHYLEVRGDVVEHRSRRGGAAAHRPTGAALLRSPLPRRRHPERARHPAHSPDRHADGLRGGRDR